VLLSSALELMFMSPDDLRNTKDGLQVHSTSIPVFKNVEGSKVSFIQDVVEHG
jgi:hypothetical protein